MSNKTSDKNVGSIEKISQTSDKNVANDSVIAHKFAVMQQQINEKDKRIQELESLKEVLFNNYIEQKQQKDKRIQELEEELVKYKDIDYMFKIDNNENRVDMKKIYFEWLDSIPKQVVIDKMKENKQILDKTNDGNLRERLYIENGIMKELLEGERK